MNRTDPTEEELVIGRSVLATLQRQQEKQLILNFPN